MIVFSKMRAALAAALAVVMVLAGAAPGTAVAQTKSKASSSAKAKSSAKKASSKSSSKGKSSSKSSRKSSPKSSPRAEKPAVDEFVSGTAAGKVVDSEGPARSYTVKKGQGLDSIAVDADVSRKQLSDLNKLKEPYRIKPGQKLKLPPLRGKAYVPEAGDTIAAIAKRFKITPKALTSYNNLSAKASVRPGRKMLLPSGFKDTGPIRESATRPKPETPVETGGRTYERPPESLAPSTSAPPPIYVRPQILPPVQPQVQAPPPMLDAGQVRDAGRGRFEWPVNGRVVQTFGSRPGERSNDGISIAVPSGTPVRAAAAGKVIYAGRQIAEFGNYVLIQHEGGFLSEYGYLDRLNVKINQSVAQGEQIGVSGQTGSAEQPELHFEILFTARREDKAAPIDPQTVLPRR